MVRIWRYAVLAILSIVINLSLSWSFCVGTDGVHCRRRLHHLQQQHHHCPHAGHRAYSIEGANQNDGERQDLSYQHSPRHQGQIISRKDLMMQGLKGLCGISMGLQWMRSKPVIAAYLHIASNVQQGDIEGSGKTFREKNRPALLEALVYLPKGVNYWGELLEGQADEEIAGEGDAKDGGEGGNEALFLTVSAGKKVVLGARVPMTGIMFPFLAQFYEDNIVGGRKAWDAVKNEDLVVRARVCATGDYPPCSKPLLRSASVSKFLLEVENPNDPSGGDVVARNVRIGATLMLKAPSAPTTLDEFNKMQKKGATEGIR